MSAWKHYSMHFFSSSWWNLDSSKRCFFDDICHLIYVSFRHWNIQFNRFDFKMRTEINQTEKKLNLTHLEEKKELTTSFTRACWPHEWQFTSGSILSNVYIHWYLQLKHWYSMTNNCIWVFLVSSILFGCSSIKLHTFFTVWQTVRRMQLIW